MGSHMLACFTHTPHIPCLFVFLSVSFDLTRALSCLLCVNWGAVRKRCGVIASRSSLSAPIALSQNARVRRVVSLIWAPPTTRFTYVFPCFFIWGRNQPRLSFFSFSHLFVFFARSGISDFIYFYSTHHYHRILQASSVNSPYNTPSPPPSLLPCFCLGSSPILTVTNRPFELPYGRSRFAARCRRPQLPARDALAELSSKGAARNSKTCCCCC